MYSLKQQVDHPLPPITDKVVFLFIQFTVIYPIILLSISSFINTDIKIFKKYLFLQSPYNKLSFNITGSGTASTYFLINPDTGEIRLKTSLLQDSINKYTVSVYAFYIMKQSSISCVKKNIMFQ